MKIDRGSQSRWRVALRACSTALAALLLVVAVNGAQAGPLADALAQARHDLAISERVLARLTERVEVARTNPATRPGERQRLDEYLVRVQSLVALNRERVRDLEKLVAEQPTNGAGGAGAAQPVAAATEAEQVAMLDQKLNESLEAFDKLLLDEARKARTREAEAGAAMGGGGGSGSGSGNGSGKPSAGSRGAKSGGEESAASERGAGESPESGTEQASQGGPRGATHDGSPGGPVGGREPGTAGPATASVPPPDVGDGNDDDIVARQIRKAAEAESDPELRKKLWDEYRKYKQGVGASG
ncbi:MAG: hypothetical protein LJE97_12640 [Betaproteobacteria bacterium]|jgi:hypothetical protein|nr:hypothetical protein [Betaproteobacteria bacterium]